MLSHKTSELFHTGLTESFFAVECSVLQRASRNKQSDECTWRRMALPSRNLFKCKQVWWWVGVACLLVICCFMLILLMYFCLFIDHVNKPVISVFGTSVYRFKNTISIFVTILISYINDRAVDYINFCIKSRVRQFLKLSNMTLWRY